MRWILALAIMTAAPAPAAATSHAARVTLIPGAFPDDRAPDGNSVIFEGDHGLVVVDTGRHKEHQAAILDRARALGKPIVAIVNTHWHLDHSGGNQEIRAVYPHAKLYTSNAVRAALDGFLASELANARKRLADPATTEAARTETQLAVDAIEDRKDLLPDVPVTGPTRLPLGKGALELHLARNAATAGDTWLYDPATRTLLAGDLVVIPAPFFDTACAEGWRTALSDIAKIGFVRLIPGHGPELSRADFDLYRLAYDRLIDCAEGPGTRQSCIDGWQRDAGLLLHTAKDHRDVQELLDYYLDRVLRDRGKQTAFCAG